MYITSAWCNNTISIDDKKSGDNTSLLSLLVLVLLDPSLGLLLAPIASLSPRGDAMMMSEMKKSENSRR